MQVAALRPRYRVEEKHGKSVLGNCSAVDLTHTKSQAFSQKAGLVSDCLGLCEWRRGGATEFSLGACTGRCLGGAVARGQMCASTSGIAGCHGSMSTVWQRCLFLYGMLSYAAQAPPQSAASSCGNRMLMQSVCVGARMCLLACDGTFCASTRDADHVQLVPAQTQSRHGDMASEDAETWRGGADCARKIYNLHGNVSTCLVDQLDMMQTGRSTHKCTSND